MTAIEDTGQYLRNYRDGYDTKVVKQSGSRRFGWTMLIGAAMTAAIAAGFLAASL